MAAGGGCACKVPAADLSELLRVLPAVSDPRVIAGPTGNEDAAVVQLAADLAIVQTLDFFTPIVDDPFAFGQIAATNAISDVYAMGATPLVALAIAGFPRDLDPAIVRRVFEGGAAAATAAGIAIVGGHTIVDPEPKYGLAVTGTVHPARIWRNGGGRVGDVLVLSKALGTGIAANALRAGIVSDDVLAAAVASMTTLNREAADALHVLGDDVHAVTDVTGFGLLGHLHEMAAGSGCSAHLELARLPLLRGILALAGDGAVPGGSRRNREAADAYAIFGDSHDRVLAAIACDAQTSGGLLAALAPGVDATAVGTIVGTLVEGPSGRILVD
jgi:selenide,water dikinase